MDNRGVEGRLLPDFDPVIEKANRVLDQVESLVQDVRRWGVIVQGNLETSMGTVRVDLKVKVLQG